MSVKLYAVPLLPHGTVQEFSKGSMCCFVWLLAVRGFDEVADCWQPDAAVHYVRPALATVVSGGTWLLGCWPGMRLALLVPLTPE